MKTSSTSPTSNEKIRISQDTIHNGIENYEVAAVHPSKKYKYMLPSNGGIFSEAAKRYKAVQPRKVIQGI